MTRREWIVGCLIDVGCPPDSNHTEAHLRRMREHGNDPWTTPDDDASGGMMRYDERAAIRSRVEEYKRSLCLRCGGDREGRILCRHCLDVVFAR